ncbi:MAG: MFS transporter [Burkholderiaceae bacterium]
MTIGGGGMYVIVVVLPTVQAEFGIARADASMPYTFLMIGFGVGGMFMGYLADRFGVMAPLLISAIGLGLGYTAAAMAGNIWTFTLAHGVLIGLLGCSASFAPLIADTSLWFVRRRGIAVAVCASGNYLGGAIWPPIVEHFVNDVGWRQTYIYLGLFSFVATVCLALLMRRRPPLTSPTTRFEGKSQLAQVSAAIGRAAESPMSSLPFGLSPGKAQALLCVAGLSCCVAMSMPQVHIVAYCSDLGFGVARGAEMLSLMLACGIVSRLVFGVICDHIGGLRTLLLASVLQMLALTLFLPFNGLASLYVIAALFGLFQGGLVPAYAIIVREHFPAKEAGSRVGMVIMFTMLGMALGGWMSGKVFDLTGSYQAAFVNGIAWNVLNLIIVITLLLRTRRRGYRPLLGGA